MADAVSPHLGPRHRSSHRTSRHHAARHVSARLPSARRRWARLLAVAATTVLMALCAAPAAAAPSGDVSGGSHPGADRFARIIIDSLTPSMVTSGSGATVTVTGEVVNTSGRTLRDLGIRLERGDAVATADQLRTSLAVEHPPVAAATPFTALTPGELGPGAKAPFSLTVPLSGGDGLRISQRGVYPLQLNVNGLPDYGGTAQVAGSRTLLPVLSLPPDADRASSYVDPVTGDDQTSTPGLGPDGSISADTSAPSRFTMLWPVAAPPQLAPGVLGGDTEPVRLISEDLARSLADGGRLNTLLQPLRDMATDSAAPGGDPGASPTRSPTAPDTSATASAESSTPPSSTPAASPPAGTAAPDADLARSICLGIDPDLLVTVRSMSLGYVVTSDPSDPMSATSPGTGQAAAAAWLNELHDIAQRMCVVALPFAAVDLRSLAAIDNAGLTTAALGAPADVVDTILGVTSVRGLTIPALGAIDQVGAQLLTASDHRTVLTSAGNLTPHRPTSTGAYRIGAVAAQTYDEPVTAALAAMGSRPTTPAITPEDQLVDLTDESALSRRQAGLGALAYAAIAAPPSTQVSSAGSSGRDTSLPTTGRSQVVMPSLYWSPTTADAQALLSTATVLLGSKVAAPTPLTAVIENSGTPGETARLSPPGGLDVASVSVPLPAATATTIGEQADLSWRLQGSLVSSADVQTTPERYLAPLREDQLRAITTPGQYGAATRDRLVHTRGTSIGAVAATLGRIQAAVTILDPGGRYTLASERSPLLLVVRNDLSLPIRVNITTSAPSDLDVGDIGTVEIPARGTRQIQLPTRADSSEAITVKISIATVTGVPMGSPITLSVHANAYGKALFIVTIIAGVALVLLTARRLWHRFRGQPDPADADRPEPDDLERLLAATTYQQRRRTLHNEDVDDEDVHDEDAHDGAVYDQTVYDQTGHHEPGYGTADPDGGTGTFGGTDASGATHTDGIREPPDTASTRRRER